MNYAEGSITADIYKTVEKVFPRLLFVVVVVIPPKLRVANKNSNIVNVQKLKLELK